VGVQEPGALPRCKSEYTPSSIMGQVQRCNPQLFTNIHRRIKETLNGELVRFGNTARHSHGIGFENDCTWVVVNSESKARLFCDAKMKAVLITPKKSREINPEACQQLQAAAPKGIIDVG
jgi:hypothetical protein